MINLLNKQSQRGLKSHEEKVLITFRILLHITHKINRGADAYFGIRGARNVAFYGSA